MKTEKEKNRMSDGSEKFGFCLKFCADGEWDYNSWKIYLLLKKKGVEYI